MAKKISLAPDPEPKFKNTGNINYLLPLLIRKSTIPEEKLPQVMQESASPLQGLRHQLMETLSAQEPEKVLKRKLEAIEEEDEPMPKN